MTTLLTFLSFFFPSGTFVVDHSPMSVLVYASTPFYFPKFRTFPPNLLAHELLIDEERKELILLGQSGTCIENAEQRTEVAYIDSGLEASC